MTRVWLSSSGIPIVFVVIGLGAVRDEYGVEDDNGDYK